jgi:hypothetical protein
MTEPDKSTSPGDSRPGYSAPLLVEIDTTSRVTLGKYAEDSADQGRYFE